MAKIIKSSKSGKTVTGQKKVVKTNTNKPTLREYKLRKMELENKRIGLNKAADTIKEVGKSAANAGRTAGVTVVANKAQDTYAAQQYAKAIASERNGKNVTDGLDRYYNAINGEPEAQGSSQDKSTTDSYPRSAISPGD